MISAILLAAGTSSRMGASNKLLLKIGNEVLIRRTARIVSDSSVSEVIVVTGHESKGIEEALLGLDVQFVFNSRYRDGMGTSVAAGVRAASEAASGYLICLGDLATLTVSEIEQVMVSFDEAKIVVPRFEGRRGNPVLVPSRFRESALGLTGDQGFRSIIEEQPDQMRFVEVSTPGILLDVDTPDDLKSVLSENPE